MSHSAWARTLVAATAALALAVGAALHAERAAPRPAAQRELQRALGGVGLGAGVVPAWSFNAFDPRLEPTCESSDWPIPGGACYSPDHVGPVSHFRPPPRPMIEVAGIPRLRLRAGSVR
jgi:hypothetical protein